MLTKIRLLMELKKAGITLTLRAHFTKESDGAMIDLMVALLTDLLLQLLEVAFVAFFLLPSDISGIPYLFS